MITCIEKTIPNLKLTRPAVIIDTELEPKPKLPLPHKNGFAIAIVGALRPKVKWVKSPLGVEVKWVKTKWVKKRWVKWVKWVRSPMRSVRRPPNQRRRRRSAAAPPPTSLTRRSAASRLNKE